MARLLGKSTSEASGAIPELLTRRRAVATHFLDLPSSFFHATPSSSSSSSSYSSRRLPSSASTTFPGTFPLSSKITTTVGGGRGFSSLPSVAASSAASPAAAGDAAAAAGSKEPATTNCEQNSAAAAAGAAAAAAAGSPEESGSNERTYTQGAINHKIRKADPEKLKKLASGHYGELDQGNLVLCLGRTIHTLSKSPLAGFDSDGKFEGQEEEQARTELLECARSLAERCCENLGSTKSSHSLANLAWALARLLELQPGPIDQENASNVSQELDDLDIQEQRKPPLLALQVRDVLRRAMELDLSTFPGRDLPVLLWSLAAVHRRSIGGAALGIGEQRELIAAFDRGLSVRLAETPAQGLAMILWSVAVLDAGGPSSMGAGSPTSASISEAPTVHIPRSLVRRTAEEASRKFEKFSARELSNAAWAFATVQVELPTWITRELPKRADELGPQESANALWALAASSESVDALLDSLAFASISTTSEGGNVIDGDASEIEADSNEKTFPFVAWKPQELANTLWALSRGGVAWVPSDSRGPRWDWQRGLLSAISARAADFNGLELAMVSVSVPTDLFEQNVEGIRDAVIERAGKLHARGALPPDAIVQLRDSLRTALGPSGVPAYLEEAYAARAQKTREALDVVVQEGSPFELPMLGVTNLGSLGTADLLVDYGLSPPPPEVTSLAEDDDDDDLLDDEDPELALLKSSLGKGSFEGTSGQTFCGLSYNFVLSAPQEAGRDSGFLHSTLREPGRLLKSGEVPEEVARALVLKSVALRFPRDRDAEFLALSVALGALQKAAAAMVATSTSPSEAVAATRAEATTTVGTASPPPPPPPPPPLVGRAGDEVCEASKNASESGLGHSPEVDDDVDDIDDSCWEDEYDAVENDDEQLGLARRGGHEDEEMSAVAGRSIAQAASFLPVGCRVHGSVRLHVTQVPCLSCISAMLQFRRLLPEVQFRVSVQPPSTTAKHSPGR